MDHEASRQEAAPDCAGGAVSEKAFKGRWRITESAVWDRSALDMIEPAYVVFAGKSGEFIMIAVHGYLDCRYVGKRVDFSWTGDDDGTLASGRGWAEVNGDDMNGMLFFHDGDETTFAAKKDAANKSTALRRPKRNPW
jgi:hypothetical protein